MSELGYTQLGSRESSYLRAAGQETLFQEWLKSLVKCKNIVRCPPVDYHDCSFVINRKESGGYLLKINRNSLRQGQSKVQDHQFCPAEAKQEEADMISTSSWFHVLDQQGESAHTS